MNSAAMALTSKITLLRGPIADQDPQNPAVTSVIRLLEGQSGRWSTTTVFLQLSHAQSQIFHNTHAYFTVAWLWPAFIHVRGRTPARLKLKVLVAMDVLGFARGLTSSDALICCQDHAVILMTDKTDSAWGLIRSWWRIEEALSFLLYSSTVTNYPRWPCLAVSPFHHNNPTFASRWQMVFYTGSAPHVVLSDRVSVSLRSSMHIKIDMAFLVVPRLVHPICFFSFLTFFTHFSHLCACLWPDKERCTCLKEFLNLSFPVRKAGGSDLSISTAHGFFCAFFVCYCFLSVRAQEKNTTSLVLWPCRVPTCVVLWNLLIKSAVPA